MAVVLVLVAGLVVAGAKALSASRETSAAQAMQSFSGDVNVYSRNWGGYPAIAANLGSPATPASFGVCTDDQEITPQTAATAYDNGFVSAGYKYTYLSNQTNQVQGSGTCTAKVAIGWELLASPTDGATKSFCSDQAGNYYLPANGTPYTTNTGAGCLTDYAGVALNLGQ